MRPDAPRFFVDRVEGPPDRGRAYLEGEEAHHAARVMRLQAGDRVVLLDNSGYEYPGEIVSFDRAAVRFTVECRRPRKSPGEPRLRLALIQGVPKGDKMDLVVQKGTEVGVSRFVPVLSERVIPRFSGAKEGRRLERWRRIASEAAKQARRGVRPEVSDVVDLVEAVGRERERGVPVVALWERAALPIREVLAGLGHVPSELALVVGPEGGFSQVEADALARSGAKLASLGARILRTETAGLVAAAVVLYEFEEA